VTAINKPDKYTVRGLTRKTWKRRRCRILRTDQSDQRRWSSV